MNLRQSLRGIGAALAGVFDLRDCTLVLGLLLLGCGLGLVSLPLALIVPGAVLVYVAVFGAGKATD